MKSLRLFESPLMKFKRNVFAFEFDNFDDWHTKLTVTLRESIQKTRSPLLRETLQDVLLALQNNDECSITVTATCEIPIGISTEFLLQVLHETFDENELEFEQGSIKATVSHRGVFEKLQNFVQRKLNSEVKRAMEVANRSRSNFR